MGIFSGTTGGWTGPNASQTAQHRQELDEYELKRAHQQRQSDLRKLQPEFEASIAGMSPERQIQARYFQKMSGLQSMMDTGERGGASTQQQRGGTVADIQKQDKTTIETLKRGVQATEEANARHQYKVDNPLAKSDNEASKIQVAKAYAGAEEWERLNQPGNDEERRQVMRDAWRDRQVVDTGVGYADVFTGKQVIAKQLIQAGVDKARVPVITESVTNFRADVDNAESSLHGSAEQITRLKFLYDNVEGNTGWWSALSIFPSGESKNWAEVRDTVIANIGLDKLMELKAGSAQGATGLGALNEKELEMLQKHKGSLLATQNPEDLKKVLKQMHIDQMKFQHDTMRTLESARNDYKSNGKRYFGMSDEQVNFMPKSQEYLFSGEPYKQKKFTSDFGAASAPSTDNQVIFDDAASYLESN